MLVGGIFGIGIGEGPLCRSCQCRGDGSESVLLLVRLWLGV